MKSKTFLCRHTLAASDFLFRLLRLRLDWVYSWHGPRVRMTVDESMTAEVDMLAAPFLAKSCEDVWEDADR